MAKFAKIIREKSENFLIKKFMSLLERKIANKRKGRFSFVLTGGKSPIRLYRSLSKNRKIPWKKIDFFIGDERFVKKTSKHSNIRMCKKIKMYLICDDFSNFVKKSYFPRFFGKMTTFTDFVENLSQIIKNRQKKLETF